LDAKRDWGHAREHVEGMHAIINHKEGDDFVLATGRTETVRRFVELAFAEVNREIVWEGEAVQEVGKDAKTGKTLVEIDPRYFRPTEVELLIGNPKKAKDVLGWEAKIELEALVSEMVSVALHNAQQPQPTTRLADF
jgi:GDPmannose 4,6-dehydratase